MTTGALMCYVPVSTDVGVPANIGPIVDNVTGQVFMVDTVDGTTSGFRRFDAYPNGNETIVAGLTYLQAAGIHGSVVYLPISQQICVVGTTGNNCQLAFYNANDFTPVTGVIGGLKVFGIPGAGFLNDTFHIEQPNAMCAIAGAPHVFNGAEYIDYIVANTLADKIINVIDSSGCKNLTAGPVDEDHALVGSAPDGSSTDAYVLGYWDDNTKPLGLYTAGGPRAANANQFGNALMFKLGTVAPSAIDPTWSTFTEVRGVAVDQTDGNPIIGVANGNATVTRAYLVKLNGNTAAVMWACAVGGNPAGVNYLIDDMQRQIIKNGTLYYLGSDSNSFWTINTKTGVGVKGTLSNSGLDVLHGSQVSEDVNNSLFWFGSWSENQTHPAYLGTTMLVDGNHGPFSATTLRYFPLGVPVPPPNYIAPAASRKRAWTYTLDGHLFYVLDLGGQGTYLYDDTTGQWCKFITGSLAQWDVANGTMWDQRIVGGDILTPDVWELQPSATQDNNATLDITRIVTGGLIKRTRVYSSLESFSLACSVGQLDDNTGATVLLEISDDQGKTWTALDTQVLTQNNYNQEIAWRSIGSFAAPGRVFRITDVGGFLRIDGADAQLDNFDEDNPTPPQGS